MLSIRKREAGQNLLHDALDTRNVRTARLVTRKSMQEICEVEIRYEGYMVGFDRSSALAVKAILLQVTPLIVWRRLLPVSRTQELCMLRDCIVRSFSAAVVKLRSRVLIAEEVA